MELKEIINLLGAISPILAAAIAFFTAKHTARKEIRKLELQWKREDTVSENRDFSEMVAAVSRYAQSGWSKHQREAIEKISVVLTKKHNPSLATLLNFVAAGNTDGVLSLLQDLARTDSTTHTAQQLKPRRQRKR